METLVFNPVFTPPVMAALWLLAGVLPLAYVLWRPTRLSLPKRLLLACLHFVPLAGLIVLLYRPMWLRIAGGNTARPVLAVLVDKSASMAAEDALGGRSRYSEAVNAIIDNSKTWRGDFDLRVFSFDKSLRAENNLAALNDVPPNGSITDAAMAIEGILRSQNAAAVGLLVSDGAHNVPESDLAGAARSARAAGVPVFTYSIGSNFTALDLGLTLSSNEEMAFIKQQVRVPVMVTQVGYDNTEVEVQLRQGEKTIDSRKVRFEGSTPTALLDFRVSRDTPGLYPYEIVVPPRSGEALASNNRRRFALRVIDERIRILLLEGKPYWDSKFLDRVLRRDPNVQITTITMFRKDRVIIESPSLLADASLSSAPKSDASDPAAAWMGPRDGTKPLEDRRFLGQFQVIMLGREAGNFLTKPAIENLREWVSTSGGHLVCTRGRPANEQQMPPELSAVLPVSWKVDKEKRLRMKLTDRGRALGLFDPAKSSGGGAVPDDPEVTLNMLPSLVTATAVERERSLSVVLARAAGEEGKEPMAVLSVQNYGSGKSIVMEGQGMWRWAFRPADDKLNSEELFRSFWANMVRWLAGSNDFLPSQDMNLRAGKPLYSAGEKPTLYVIQRETPEIASGTLPPLPKIEIIREDAFGYVDRSHTPLRVTVQPMPREPNMFKAELEALEEGQYRARLVDVPKKVEASFEILPPMKEKLDLRARPAVLEDISRMTDARKLNKEELGNIGTLFTEYVRHHHPGREIREPAWDKPLFWISMMCVLALTWWVRRRWGAI